MKGKSFGKKKGAYQNGSNGKNRSSLSKDSFSEPTKSKRRRNFEDEIIDSSDEDVAFGSDAEIEVGKDEEIIENPAEKKRRLAHEHLATLREMERKHQVEDADDFDVEDRENDGNRDSLIARALQQEQQEESGRLRKAIASRYLFG